MQTLEELVAEVARTKTVDTSVEAKIKYQDLIGHCTVDELEKLANIDALRDSFYRIYDEAYGIVATINYYVNHDDKATQMKLTIQEQDAELEKGSKLIEDLRVANKRLNDELYSLREQLAEAQMNVKEMERNLGVKDEEIIRFKAKLYDLEEKIK